MLTELAWHAVGCSSTCGALVAVMLSMPCRLIAWLVGGMDCTCLGLHLGAQPSSCLQLCGNILLWLSASWSSFCNLRRVCSSPSSIWAGPH